MTYLRFLIVFFTLTPLFAQHLPTGSFQTSRERTYDIIHYKANLKLDWANKKILGESTIRLRPLGSVTSVSFDAYRLSVSKVRETVSGKDAAFSSTDSTLQISFGRTLQAKDTVTVHITYTATPTAGLYFIDAPTGSKSLPTIFTYGEGGIHANWLPIYNETNDKFSSEMIVTVAKPYQAISNGALLSATENSDGTRTFHWSQQLPHPNYLIALFVGEYVPVALRPAFGTIPLSVWTPPGSESEAKLVFQRTPEMIEFFSNRFSYRYPWDKYDQVAAYDYAIGAMENTSITGHNDRILRSKNQLEEFNPDFSYFTSNWTSETLISHELAHHWFGDNLTCSSLASIWLNESFASYCMMLWDEQRLGREYLQSQTWLALQAYLRYVKNQHIIRPLEYHYFDSRTEIYNEETTYLKGGVVLNMLRWVLGDDDFFKALGYYLHKHQFSNVESTDLKKAIEEATGKNLEWFFDQWVYGGGHPLFEVHYNYLTDRKKVEVEVQQTQPMVEGQGLFKLPVEIRIDAAGKSRREVVWVEKQTDYFLFDVPEKPDLVSFDGQGALVCDLIFEKERDELVYQLQNDELPGRLWALRQLVANHASDPHTLLAIQGILKSQAYWFLKAEATLQLQQLNSPEAERLALEQIQSKDDHIRKAAVLALKSKFTDGAKKALRRVVEEDVNNEIAATALVSLSHIETGLPAEYLRHILTRKAWYDVNRLAVLTVIENLADKKLVSIAKEHASPKYNYAIRQQALKAWAACAPTDPQLIDVLLHAGKHDILPVRATAFAFLAKLKVEGALPQLEDIARTDGDGDIRKAAKDAVEEIRRVMK